MKKKIVREILECVIDIMDYLQGIIDLAVRTAVIGLIASGCLVGVAGAVYAIVNGVAFKA